jgi:hypothetical protein
MATGACITDWYVESPNHKQSSLALLYQIEASPGYHRKAGQKGTQFLFVSSIAVFI